MTTLEEHQSELRYREEISREIALLEQRLANNAVESIVLNYHLERERRHWRLFNDSIREFQKGKA